MADLDRMEEQLLSAKGDLEAQHDDELQATKRRLAAEFDEAIAKFRQELEQQRQEKVAEATAYHDAEVRRVGEDLAQKLKAAQDRANAAAEQEKVMCDGFGLRNLELDEDYNRRYQRHALHAPSAHKKTVPRKTHVMWSGCHTAEGGGLHWGMISWGMSALKEGSGIFPWRHLGVSAAQCRGRGTTPFDVLEPSVSCDGA